MQPLVPEDSGSSPALRDSLGGSSQTYRFHSNILNETRRVVVAAPPSFAHSGTRRYPLVISFDGESLFAPLWSAATFLTAAGHIPEAVFVGIANTDRLRDLTPPGLSVSGSGLRMGGSKFLDFLERELIPAMTAQFRAGEPVVLVGHSSGGILATWAVAARDRFPWAIAIDSPTHLGDGWLGKRMKERIASSGKPVRYISLEARFGWTDKEWAELKTSAPQGWLLSREKLQRESHESMTLLASYLGLRHIFEDYSDVGRPITTAAKTFARYAALESAYGAKIAPPRATLSRLVEDLIVEGRRDQAATALELLEQTYGATGNNAQQLRKQLSDARKRPPLKENVDDMLAAPRPTAAEGSRFVGEWEGESTANDDPPRPIRMRLVISDGKLEGEWTSYPAPGAVQVSAFDFVRITSGGEGIDVGYMNGMRPRGLIVHELKFLPDGTLEGQFQMRGVDFQLPAGVRAFPSIRARLRRINAK